MAGRDGRRRAAIDKGPIQARAKSARAFLSIADRVRLEMLVNTPPEKLLEQEQITLPKAKRLRTESEERAALFKAVRDEAEVLLNKAARAPHAAERRDPIGRAWFEGLLDGHGIDAAVLRDLGREYGSLYWMDLQSLGTAQCGYDERIGRPNVRYKFRMAELTGKDAARFAHFDNILTATGHQVRRSVQALCVDDIWFLEGPPWLDRCINSRRSAKIERGEASDRPYGDGARRSDIVTLTYAIAGLKALAGGLGR
jgi:hypothetical protein